MKREASEFKPDAELESVRPEDIPNRVIENRHIADNEIDAAKIEQVVDGETGIPIVISKNITEGAAAVSIFDANAPFKMEIIDIIVQPRGASANGTMKVTDGTNDISDAIVAAVDKTIGRASTIDDAYSTIAKDGSLEVACAGDVIADTIGLVTIIAVKRD